MLVNALRVDLLSFNDNDEIAVRVEFPLLDTEVTTWDVVFEIDEYTSPVIVVSIPEVTAL